MHNVLGDPLKLGSFLGKIPILRKRAFFWSGTIDPLKAIFGHFEANAF